MAKDINSIFFDITPEIEELALKCETNNAIDKELYTKYEVKRGLRDLNGKGVLAGLTNISDVCATKIVDGVSVPCAGNLYYRGYNIKDLVSGFLEAKHFGFEEIAYLLLFGDLPSREELKKFHPSLEVEDAEEAIYNQDLTDAADLLVKMMKEAEEKEEK